MLGPNTGCFTFIIHNFNVIAGKPAPFSITPRKKKRKPQKTLGVNGGGPYPNKSFWEKIELSKHTNHPTSRNLVEPEHRSNPPY